MKIKKIFIFLIAVVISVTYVLWTDGSLNPNKKEINDYVYLEKLSDNTFSLTCKFGSGPKKVGSMVDSVIVTPKYGTVFYGMGINGSKKQWYYIDASKPGFNKVHGGWNDLEFRKDEVELLVGKQFLDSVHTAYNTWNNN